MQEEGGAGKTPLYLMKKNFFVYLTFQRILRPLNIKTNKTYFRAFQIYGLGSPPFTDMPVKSRFFFHAFP